ncbi:MAG: D-tyrosyl-tRNA(Tyr) deacylase [Spirochaetales bacterium]|nr:D-tyrosyl-tRNA(Tyr) deacylase [Spirochaetales bacterium]
MRAVVQRVRACAVHVGGVRVGSVNDGLLVYLGVSVDDHSADATYLATKVLNLRIFADDDRKMNLSALDLKKEILVVSQFTLFGDARKGRRPSYTNAAKPEIAKALCDEFVQSLRSNGAQTEEGSFGSIMDVSYTNHGPVTILLDSKKLF